MIIDDASHEDAYTLRTLAALLPLLAPRGVYIIEDHDAAFADVVRASVPGQGYTVAADCLRDRIAAWGTRAQQVLSKFHAKRFSCAPRCV